MTHSPIDRRSLLLHGSAALAASALPAPLHAANSVTTTKQGAFEITVVSDGHLVLPTSLLAPEAPKAERDAALKAAGQTGEQFDNPTNVTLIRTPSDLILIDMGSGDRFMPTAGKLAENMTAAGIDKGKITKVVFTHGHPDHLWGTLDELDDLLLPDAAYYVGAAEWDFWNGDNALRGLPEERQGFVTGARRNFARIKDRVTMVQADGEIVPGLRMISTPGHTQGHMSLEVEGGQGMIVGGDALTHSQIALAHPDWRNPADHEQDPAAVTRRKLLDRLAADRTRLIGFHLPYPGIGVVERKDAAYRFLPTV